MKKILFIVEDITFSGGLENVVLKLASYFVKNDFFHVDILSLKCKSKRFHDFNNKVGLYGLNIPHFRSVGNGLFKIKKYTDYNEKEFSSFFSNNYYDFTIATTYSIASLLDRVEIDSLKIVWEHTHFYGYCDPIRHYSGLKGKLRKIYNELITHPSRAKLYNKFNSVVVLTEIDKLNWQHLHCNVVAIHNPLTLNLAESNAIVKKKQFISIGRLTEQKGYSYLIEAFSLFKKIEQKSDYKLIIVGDGPLRNKLEHEVISLGLEDSVSLLGLRKDIINLLDESEIYISTSVYEGFGLTLVEAQSRGLPIISFDCLAGPREIMNNSNGVLVPNRNVSDLAKTMSMLTNDKEKKDSMSFNAFTNSKRFDTKLIAEKWKNHLECLKNEQ